LGATRVDFTGRIATAIVVVVILMRLAILFPATAVDVPVPRCAM
jgi:hypothetical protein